MTRFTNQNLEFLSNEDLIRVLQSVLREIDVVANAESYRSTTYLAVSAIEGLFGELRKLLDITPKTVPSGQWPQTKNKDKNKIRDKTINELKLEDMIEIFKAMSKLPQNFEALYHAVRHFRNYMHPESELKDLRTDFEPIQQSVAFAALACLSALIEKYESIRFVAGQQWRLMYGFAQIPSNNLMHLPHNDFVSLIVSEQPADHFREINFRLKIPRNGIFNFIYSYSSKDDFLGARIEGRESEPGKGLDNGRLHCAKWRDWSLTARYKHEPDPSLREHAVKIVLDPTGTFNLVVDQVQLELEDNVSWDFDPQKKIGFMAEHKLITLADMMVIPR